MEPRYDINEVESRIEKQWEDSGLFNPDVCVEKGFTKPDAEPFCIVLPPPNVTGTLHIGHAFEDTLQDIAVRYARMRGKRTLWIPGTDHAAIATQAKVEKEILKKEGKNRHDLGREEFLKRVNEFAQASHDTIVRQIKRLGASLDWTREAYTLDDRRNLGVRTAFKKMHDLGLIYRGNRVVNWDPKGQTVISDDEVLHEERKAKLYTFRYDKNFPVAIATTRLETKFGDTAVAVNPFDERYKQYVGKEYDAVYCGVPIHVKVIADESVEKDFGTGALGVTPAHSMVDWEIAERHKLPLVQVINEYGKMTVEGPVNGMKTEEARSWVAEELRKQGLIEKEEEITQNVSIAERTGAIIEPLPKLQWFVAVNKEFDRGPLGKTTLKQLMRDAVASGKIRITPERFEKVYFHWIDNLRDWCISRQIWFGHQVPVWYKGEEIYVGIKAPEGSEWQQDQDTLDTWFSSGLWPFSTLGWPHFAETASRGKPGPENDFATYFPNTLMAPGYEILQLWVARMILMSGVLLDEIPFKTVLIHGIVRDSKGQKFSKSLGNGIDPLVLAGTYGADALRMALIVGAAPGNDVKFDEQRVKGYRNFSTKIWNIARFIEMNKVAIPVTTSVIPAKAGIQVSSEAHKKYIVDLESLKSEVTAHLDTFEFHLAGEKLYHYVWHELADVIIEAEKEKLKNGTDEEKAASHAVLEQLLLESLKLLHPFMPFITEEIYQIFRPGKILMVEKW
jgi:valyl-tRNA synthetase